MVNSGGEDHGRPRRTPQTRYGRRGPGPRWRRRRHERARMPNLRGPVSLEGNAGRASPHTPAALDAPSALNTRMQAPPQPPADLLPVQRKATLAYRAIRLWAVPLLHALFRITVEGRDQIPTTGAYVLIANHLNWLDSFAILATFPAEPRVHFLGDTTMLVRRKVQWALVKSVGGYIPVNRQARPDVVLF